MPNNLQAKLKQLPKLPGVYFHKDNSGQIIYVGKASNLNNRVRSYFQKNKFRDPKTEVLVNEIADTDWIITESEAEALFLEAEQVRRYQPKYNILLRDDKSVCFVRINIKDDAPSVTITRRPLDDGAEYFGPFLNAGPVRKSLKVLRKIFPYSTHITLPSRGCLLTHIGLCPGPETNNFNRKKYLKDLRNLISYMRGNRVILVNELENDMNSASKKQEFEKAAQYRNKLTALNSLRVKIIFSDRENMDLSKDHALFELFELLGLAKPPRRIEGYDISHMSGTDTVASMVVFTNGVSDKSSYRKFKMRIPGNDDFAHMNEVITRRLSEKNLKQWGNPDLILIDGGKGQLSSALAARDSYNKKIPMVGLAKKFEEIVVNKESSLVEINDNILKKLKGFRTDESDDFVRLDLPDSSNLVKLLQRIRDESHRFAVSYHTTLKTSRQTVSSLDSVAGIGPATKKKLIRHFGSTRAAIDANKVELEKIVGKKITEQIKAQLGDTGTKNVQ